MKSYIQFRLLTFETINVENSPNSSNLVATINKCVETSYNVQRVYHSQQHTSEIG